MLQTIIEKYLSGTLTKKKNTLKCEEVRKFHMCLHGNAAKFNICNI